MLVYEAIGESIQRLGVTDFFGLMGRMNMRFLLHMAERCGLRYFSARHEAAAVGMAIGYTRASGRLGVCTVTLGPGVTNTLTSVVEAQKSRTPLLLLTGDAAAVRLRDNQHLDQRAVFHAVDVTVVPLGSPVSVVDDLLRAARQAVIGRRPVVVPIPLDIQERPTSAEPAKAAPIARTPPARPVDAAISQMADLVMAARRPIILAGRGATSKSARHVLTLLADRTGALLATTLDAAGLFVGHPFYVGTAGVHASPLAVRLIQQADAVMAFGCSLNHFTTRAGHLFRSDVAIIHCDLEEAATDATPAACRVVGDAAASGEALLAELSSRQHRATGFHTPAIKRELAGYDRADGFQDQSGNGFVDPRSVFVALDRWLPRDRAVVPETGHACGYALDYLLPGLGGGINVVDFQAIGLGLGVATGAAIARPERITVAVIGDGGLLMTAGELDSMVRYRLPVLVLVMNDAAFGAEARELERRGMSIDPALFPEVDMAQVGRALGAGGLTVRTLGDLELLKPWIDRPAGPMVVDCKLDPRVPADWFIEMVGSEQAYMRRPRPGY